MKNGTLIKKVDGSVWVALNVSAQRFSKGLNCKSQGLHLFKGFWYSRGNWTELDSWRGVYKNLTHKDVDCYGKISSLPKNYKILGYARNSYIIRKKL
jgi:hypothetical protein